MGEECQHEWVRVVEAIAAPNQIVEVCSKGCGEKRTVENPEKES